MAPMFALAYTRMMTLELNDEEMALVRLLVQWRLSGLAVEIDHTDSREFRALLRVQRDALERLSQRLTPPGSG